MQNLQHLFMQTQENYQCIPDFIEQLLKSDVYCLGRLDNHQKIQFRVLETPEGDQAIAFFLTLEMLQHDIGQAADYVCLNTRKLFEMTLGATLVLNPTSELFKEFQPQEIKAILEIDSDQSASSF